MRYVRGACGVSRWNEESNMQVFVNFGMDVAGKGLDSEAGDIWYC